MLTLTMSPLRCVTPDTSKVQLRFKPLCVEFSPILRFEGKADGSALLIPLANAADMFEFEAESIVVATLGNAVTF